MTQTQTQTQSIGPITTVGFGKSDIGKQRESNEDRFHIDNALGLFVVCDGMGGHAGGEVAARMTVDAVVARLNDSATLLDQVRKDQAPLPAVQTLLTDAIRSACETVYQAATNDRRHAGMGTTVTAVITVGDKAIMAHVGDTRLYLLRSGEVSQISADHTVIAEMIRSGVMTAEEGRRSPYAHALTRAVGTQPACQVDTLVFPLLPQDRLLLCSDGLTEYLDGQKLAGFLEADLEDIPDALVQAANEAGGRDNITVIVVGLRTDDAPGADVAGTPADDLLRLDAIQASFVGTHLSLAGAQRVANQTEIRRFSAGDSLVGANADPGGMIILLQGSAHVVGEAGSRAMRCNETMYVGSLLTETSSPWSLVAQTDGAYLFLSRDRLQALASRRPWLGVELMANIGKHCADTLVELQPHVAWDRVYLER